MADIPESTKLLPCPFCGGPGHLQHSTFEIDAGWHVVCHGQKDCPLYCSEPYQVHGDEADAVTRWNTRAAPPAIDREAVEKVREAASAMLPKNVCLANPRWPDETVVPLETTLGELRALAAALSALSADAIRQGEGEAVAWCSPGQLANLTDVDRDAGVYLPIRKTKRGNFTMPLFSTPASHASDGGKADG